MKINANLHGIIDYIVVLFLFSAPTLFHLPEMTALFTYVLGGIHLTLTLLTNFKYGVFKVIPFPIHGWIELIVSVGLMGVAFYFGGREGMLARNFYLFFAAAVFVTWAVTDYRSVESGTQQGASRNRRM